mgnify:CR=1 FL=1
MVVIGRMDKDVDEGGEGRRVREEIDVDGSVVLRGRGKKRS